MWCVACCEVKDVFCSDANMRHICWTHSAGNTLCSVRQGCWLCWLRWSAVHSTITYNNDVKLWYKSSYCKHHDFIQIHWKQDTTPTSSWEKCSGTTGLQTHQVLGRHHSEPRGQGHLQRLRPKLLKRRWGWGHLSTKPRIDELIRASPSKKNLCKSMLVDYGEIHLPPDNPWQHIQIMSVVLSAISQRVTPMNGSITTYDSSINTHK